MFPQWKNKWCQAKEFSPASTMPNEMFYSRKWFEKATLFPIASVYFFFQKMPPENSIFFAAIQTKYIFLHMLILLHCFLLYRIPIKNYALHNFDWKFKKRFAYSFTCFTHKKSSFHLFSIKYSSFVIADDFQTDHNHDQLWLIFFQN